MGEMSTRVPLFLDAQRYLPWTALAFYNCAPGRYRTPYICAEKHKGAISYIEGYLRIFNRWPKDYSQVLFQIDSILANEAMRFHFRFDIRNKVAQPSDDN